MYAMWVLIVISNWGGSGVTTGSVPGFFSLSACTTAANAWVAAMKDDTHAVGGKAFCVYTGDHPERSQGSGQ
jgi:hypothetical protein